MSFVIDLNLVCLVCLQEGELRSVFDKDGTDLSIGEKIMKCSDLFITDEMKIPDKICASCTIDLNVAYRFRKNCDTANTFFKSILEEEVMSDYDAVTEITMQDKKIKIPSGLKVKRIQPRCDTANTVFKSKEEVMSDYGGVTEATVQDQKIGIPSELKIERIQPKARKAAMGNIVAQCIKSELNEPYLDEEETYSTADYFENAEILEEYEFVEPLDEMDSQEPELPTIEQKDDIKLENYIKQEINNLSQVVLEEKTRRGPGRPRKYEKSLLQKANICEICGNSYKHPRALDSHMRRHRNERPYHCQYCDKAFVSSVELTCHKRVHTGEKPYPCQYCGRRFSDFGSRIKHERTHTGERPYLCGICGKLFAYSDALNSHIRAHTGEKKYKCKTCERGFTKMPYLKRHMLLHNPESVNNKHAEIKVLNLSKVHKM